MVNISDLLRRRLIRITRSLNVQKIYEFILKEAPDDETKCKMIVLAMRRLKSLGRSGLRYELVMQFDRNKKLPKYFCGEIIREFIRYEESDPQLVKQSANITAQQLFTSDETILSATCDWLQSKQYSVTLLESIEKENGKELMKILVKKKPRIICYLLHRPGMGREIILDLLNRVADDDMCPMEIFETISDIFEDCVHSERWAEIANNILEIGSILNPVNEPKEAVRVDTAYLMNWCKQKGHFSNNTPINIQDFIGELDGLITSSSALKCLHEVLQNNRTVDHLLMLMDQGIKRYRGHDIHQFNVAAIGLFFLDTYVEKNCSLEEYLARFYEKQFNKPIDVKETWLLTSLLHDHALPITYMFKMAPIICKIIEEGIEATEDVGFLNSCTKAYQKHLEALRLAYNRLFSKRLFSVYKLFERRADYSRERLKKLVFKEMSRIGLCKFANHELNHGVLGAANITSLFPVTLNNNVEVAARAIGMHDLKNEQISFKKDPLTFLLVLCDELQEWGREIALYPEILMDISSMTIGKFRIEAGQRFFTDHLIVSYRLFKNAKITGFDKDYFMNKKKELLEYRLIFDAPDVFPKIEFDEPTESNLPCKEEIESEWAWG